MRSYTFLFFALCSVFSLSAAQTASATTESTVETSTVEATTGVTTSPTSTVSSGGGGTASNATTSLGGGTGTTTSAGSSSTKGPPDVLLKVPNLSVKRIEYAIICGSFLSCVPLLITPQTDCREPPSRGQSQCRDCFSRDHQCRRRGRRVEGQHHHRGC